MEDLAAKKVELEKIVAKSESALAELGQQETALVAAIRALEGKLQRLEIELAGKRARMQQVWCLEDSI